jgi:hypothetical protein
MKGAKGKESGTTVTAVNEQGEVLETLEGYQLRILRTSRRQSHGGGNRQSWSTGRTAITRTIETVGRSFGIDAPTLRSPINPVYKIYPAVSADNRKFPYSPKQSEISSILPHHSGRMVRKTSHSLHLHFRRMFQDGQIQTRYDYFRPSILWEPGKTMKAPLYSITSGTTLPGD